VEVGGEQVIGATLGPQSAITQIFEKFVMRIFLRVLSCVAGSWFRQLTVVSIICFSMASAALAQGTKEHRPGPSKSHRLLIHVDQNDPAVMNLALNNATNVIEYYRAKGEDVSVDVVAYGPGLHMLRVDTSPMQDRIKQLKGMAFPSNCPVLRLRQHHGEHGEEGRRPVAVLSDATVVPSGVVQLMEEAGRGLELRAAVNRIFVA
jgi:intracellular sulfur oxidation DsrE/DsrF family protein